VSTFEDVCIDKPGRFVVVAPREHPTSSKTLAEWTERVTAVRRAVEFGGVRLTVRDTNKPSATKGATDFGDQQTAKAVAYGFALWRNRVAAIIVQVFGSTADAHHAAELSQKFLSGDLVQRIAMYGSDIKGWEVVVEGSVEIVVLPVDSLSQMDKQFGLIDFSIDGKLPD
jgi:hypothetical protein